MIAHLIILFATMLAVVAVCKWIEPHVIELDGRCDGEARRASEAKRNH